MIVNARITIIFKNIKDITGDIVTNDASEHMIKVLELWTTRLVNNGEENWNVYSEREQLCVCVLYVCVWERGERGREREKWYFALIWMWMHPTHLYKC